jgi:hypothetical protein
MILPSSASQEARITSVSPQYQAWVNTCEDETRTPVARIHISQATSTIRWVSRDFLNLKGRRNQEEQGQIF